MLEKTQATYFSRKKLSLVSYAINKIGHFVGSMRSNLGRLTHFSVKILSVFPNSLTIEVHYLPAFDCASERSVFML